MTYAPTLPEIREIMKRPPLENALNLPEPLVRAIEKDNYNRGSADFTVTQLGLPPRIAYLRAKHANSIRQDASELIFTLFGKAIHSILEHSAGERYIVEKRFQIEFEGATVSGQIDLYDKETKTLQDWKITSRWTTADGPKDEWVAQGNLNKYILWKNGIEVKKIEYVAIYRDWSKMQAALKPNDYPQRQVETLEIPMWGRQEVENYLSERIAMHRAAKAGDVPECTPKERWARPDRYALKKRGAKRALQLFDDLDKADAALANAGDGYGLEPRPGSNVRCRHYCDCLPYCSFGQMLVREEVEK